MGIFPPEIKQKMQGDGFFGAGAPGDGGRHGLAGLGRRRFRGTGGEDGRQPTVDSRGKRPGKWCEITVKQRGLCIFLGGVDAPAGMPLPSNGRFPPAQTMFPLSGESERKHKPEWRGALAKIELFHRKSNERSDSDAEWSKSAQTCFHCLEKVPKHASIVWKKCPNTFPLSGKRFRRSRRDRMLSMIPNRAVSERM